MTVNDQFSGVAVALCGGFLLTFLIPNYVTAIPGDLRDPSLFPRLAAWMLVGLGFLQILFPGRASRLPTKGEILRGALVVCALILSTFAMPRFGFIPVMIALMTFTTLLMMERRILWLVVVILGVPIGAWLLFDVLFGRPMP